MSLEPRRKPYLWPTWISPLLSGEKHCEWAAWVKAHYNYTKRPDTRENSLTQWKAEHAAGVSRRAADLEADGWAVSVEDQNKFTYRGQAAAVGGCPDIVAQKMGVVRIDDVKTGKQRDSDFWQVAIYGMLLPLVDRALSELVVHAAVVYRDRVRHITPAEIVQAQPLIVTRIKQTAATMAPARRPSDSECAFCDIADCPERVETVDGKVVDGDAF